MLLNGSEFGWSSKATSEVLLCWWTVMDYAGSNRDPPRQQCARPTRHCDEEIRPVFLVVSCNPLPTLPVLLHHAKFCHLAMTVGC
jgi:hypothetical protein